MVSRIVFTIALLFSVSSFAQQCETLEQAKVALADYAAMGRYPFSGRSSVKNFSQLEAVEDSDEAFCHDNGEDCGEANIDFGMNWSFEPGLRGWIGISKTCQVDYAITFKD